MTLAPESLTVSVARIEIRSIHGLVLLLCNARLALLALMVIRAAVAGDTASAAFVALALLPSWLPLRTWTARPERFHRSRSFLALDSVVTVTAVWGASIPVGVWELGVAYLLVSAALTGVLAHRGSAVLVTALVSTASLPSILAGGLEVGWAWPVPLAALGMAYGASGLSRDLRRQGVLVRRSWEAREHAAAEEERAALAREMHDSLTKTVHGIDMLASSLSQRLQDEGSPSEPMALQIARACSIAQAEAREVLTGLRTPFEETLDQMVRLEGSRWSAEHKIPTTVHVDTDLTGLEFSPATVFTFRRILGELLENVARHARASQVDIGLTLDTTCLTLSVEDDGVGMTDDDLQAAPLDGHFGLLGVRERAAAMGAEFTTERAARGRGLRAEVHLPRAEWEYASIPAMTTKEVRR